MTNIAAANRKARTEFPSSAGWLRNRLFGLFSTAASTRADTTDVRWASDVLAFAVLLSTLVSSLCLFGWLLRWRILASWGSAFTTMKANTAFCLLLATTALWLSRTPLLRSKNSVWVVILSALTVIVAGLTLGECIFHWNFGIDELLFRDFEHLRSSPPPGRMAPGTAIAFLLSAYGILFIDRLPRAAHVTTLLTFFIALIGLLGYLYQLPTISGAGRFTSLAINTIVGLMALCIGVLVSRSDRGLMGLLTLTFHHRFHMRVLISGAIFLPTILGLVVLSGQRLGFYGGEFTLVLFAVLLIVVTVALVWATGAQQLMAEMRRRTSEEALRESEERFRAMADNIPNLAFMAHADGVVFWYNSRWYDYTGMTLESLHGWGWQVVHDPKCLEAVVSRWREALDSGMTFEMEFPLRGRDGVYRWFLTRVSPVRDDTGKVIRWFGTNTNINDKRKAEDGLKESEELARSVIEGSPDGVEVLDEAGGIVLANQQAQKFRGLRYDMSVPWVESWKAGGFDPATTAFATALSGRPATFTIGLCENSTETTWLDVSLVPLKSASGSVKRVLSVTRDVSGLRKAEEQLAQTAKLESLGVMAGGIAHDFNNLLTGILGNASLIANVIDLESRCLVDDISNAAERAADLTKQMLAFSGRGRFEVKALDLSAQVREILPLIKPMIGKNVEIQLGLGEELSRTQGDPSQIHQLIMNLIINGAEAIGSLQGRVVVTTADTEIDEAQTVDLFYGSDVAAGRYVILEIRDTGCGMDEDTKKKIFDPFFTTKLTGRGLGLAAVSGIVRGHKGALCVSSSPGDGTTFKIFLPANEKHREPAPIADVSDERPYQGHETILLVDDEAMVRQVGKACLQREGYRVLLANNGREAVDLFQLRSNEISLVILDMNMPVMGGKAALALLSEIRPDIPIILCSGYNEAEVVQKRTTQTAAGFVQKPYTASSLAKSVKNVLASAKKSEFAKV